MLIVVRGYDYRSDLDALRPYISEYKPLLMGVDGGADALIEAGYKPDMIIGDMDSCSDATLKSGAELVVHAYHDGRAPGLERITALGLEAVVFPALGTSEDAAMLLADSKGAQLLVAVGTHASLVEFLDKGRPGMASTFLTRLRVGPKLVDAKGVSRIYRSQIKTWTLVLLVLSGLLALVTALLFTDVGSAVGSVIVARIRDALYWIKELVHLINFRYHIVSLMAVFIALSVGIAVGVSLSPSVDQGIIAQAAQDRKQVTDLRAELDRRNALDEYREAYDCGSAGSSPRTCQRLRVAIVAMPDAPTAVVEAISTAAEEAGANVVRDVKVNADAFDPSQTDKINEALAPWASDINSDESMASATKVGLALARSITARGVLDRDSQALAIGDALNSNGWVTISKGSAPRPNSSSWSPPKPSNPDRRRTSSPPTFSSTSR